MNAGEYVTSNGNGQSILIPAGFIIWIIVKEFYAVMQ
jgi:hypothetical protein